MELMLSVSSAWRRAGRRRCLPPHRTVAGEGTLSPWSAPAETSTTPLTFSGGSAAARRMNLTPEAPSGAGELLWFRPKRPGLWLLHSAARAHGYPMDLPQVASSFSDRDASPVRKSRQKLPCSGAQRLPLIVKVSFYLVVILFRPGHAARPSPDRRIRRPSSTIFGSFAIRGNVRGTNPPSKIGLLGFGTQRPGDRPLPVQTAAANRVAFLLIDMSSTMPRQRLAPSASMNC